MDVDSDHQTTGAVIGAAIAVHRELGPGVDEAAYEGALALKLQALGIAHTCQAPLRINYRGTSLDCGYRYDLLVDPRLPIELKAVEQILPIHQAQLLTYMRLGSHPLGLLINFDVPVLKEGIQRMALTRLPPTAAVSSVDHGVHLDFASAEILASAEEVHRTLGPGLLRSAYEECLCHEFRQRGVAHERQRALPLQFEGRDLAHHAHLSLVVGETVPVVCVSAPQLTRLHECRLLARLRQTGWSFGWLINFNSPTLQTGIRRIAL